VHAFSGDLTRVVTFRAATDWGESLLNLGDDFEEE
jgi:hypothetical protein